MEVPASAIPQIALHVARQGHQVCAEGVTLIEEQEEDDGNGGQSPPQHSCKYFPVRALPLPLPITEAIAASVARESDHYWFAHKHKQRLDVYKVSREAGNNNPTSSGIDEPESHAVAAWRACMVRSAMRRASRSAAILQAAVRATQQRLKRG
jgi:hypothetical protein